jgi:hypothetical protein
MHRPGSNPDAMLPSDILCDFCERPWSDDLPMVEGHRGSCICGPCLAVAWSAVVDGGLDDAPPPPDDPDGPPSWTCALCLEPRRDPAFASPMRPEAFVCRRCIRLAGRALHDDPSVDWTKPSSGSVADRARPEDAS